MGCQLLHAYIVYLQVANWGADYTFAFYAAWLGITIVFVYLCVPETKGLGVEQISALFGEGAGQARDAEMSRHLRCDTEACFAACSLYDLKEIAHYAAKRDSQASATSAVEMSIRPAGEVASAAESCEAQPARAPQDAGLSEEARPLHKTNSRIRISARGSVAIA